MFIGILHILLEEGHGFFDHSAPSTGMRIFEKSLVFPNLLGLQESLLVCSNKDLLGLRIHQAFFTILNGIITGEPPVEPYGLIAIHALPSVFALNGKL